MGRHFARRVDKHQADEVSRLRASQFDVIHTFRHGEDAPDYIVSSRYAPGLNLMVEHKTPGLGPISDTAKRDARRRRQRDTRELWPGAYIQAERAEDVFAWFVLRGHPASLYPRPLA